MAKQFIVIEKLTSKEVNNNIVSQRYDIKEIKETFGNAKLIKEDIQLNQKNEIFLILTFEDLSERRHGVVLPK